MVKALGCGPRRSGSDPTMGQENVSLQGALSLSPLSLMPKIEKRL